jgi:hypothetical protein
MKVEPYIPFCLVTARDLKLIAEKWLEEQKGKTLPTSALIFQGRYTLSEFKKKSVWANLRTRTSSNRQYFLKNPKELIKKKEKKAAGKFPEDSLFFSK